MRRRDFFGAAAAGLGSACGPTALQEGGRLEPLTIVAYFAPSTAGLYLANARGYFREAGFEVEVERLAALGTIQALPALATGRADAAFFGLSPSFVNAVGRGLSLRIVMAREVIGPDCPIFGTLVGRREVFPEGLDDLSALRGKTVAMPQEATVGEFFMETLLKEGGLTPSDLTRGPVGREALPALRAGRIDAMFASDIQISEAEIGKDFVVSRALTELLGGFATQFVYFGESLLAAEDDRGARFLAAFMRGLDLYRQGETPEELLRFLSDRQADTKRALGFCRKSFAEEGESDLGKIGLFADWCFEKGYSYRRVTAEELVDLRFLEPAARLREEAE